MKNFLHPNVTEQTIWSVMDKKYLLLLSSLYFSQLLVVLVPLFIQVEWPTITMLNHHYPKTRVASHQDEAFVKYCGLWGVVNTCASILYNVSWRA